MPGAPFLLLGNTDLPAHGYQVEEFRVSGSAISYTLAEDARDDGYWTVAPAAAAPFATRIVAIRPRDPDGFNGTLVVEWLNVSGGLDVPVEWVTLHREMLREGYAYVAVSAQFAGVEGGPSLAAGTSAPLKAVNTERYGTLCHPGDAFSFDIFSQVGRFLKGPQGSRVLGSLVPERAIAVGESQAALYLTTYVNAVDPVDKVYDGFLIHSRFGSAPPLTSDPVTNIKEWPTVKLRTDLRAPVLAIITETDLIGTARFPGFLNARQPDTERLRIWEIAGAAHADNYLFGVGMIDNGSIPMEQLAEAWAPIALFRDQQLDEPINNGPQHHYVTQAALWNLERWIKTGVAPAQAAPLEVLMKDGSVQFVVDHAGHAQGGVRTPWVDVPTAQLSGFRDMGPVVADIVGRVRPFTQAALAKLYPGGKTEYLQKFQASLTEAIAKGFILAADRQEILELAGLAYGGAGKNQ